MAGEAEGTYGIFFNRTQMKLREAIKNHSEGERSVDEVQMHWMLVGIHSRDRFPIRSVGWRGLPRRVYTISMHGETEIIGQLPEDIRENFGIGLSSNLDHHRGKTGGGNTVEYAVLGGSGARLLGEALTAKGKKVTSVAESGWRATKAGVEKLVEKIKEQRLEGQVVIFLPLDNTSFYSEDEDRGRSFLVKLGEDNTYHIIIHRKDGGSDCKVG
jgi:hypothetical protein